MAKKDEVKDDEEVRDLDDEIEGDMAEEAKLEKFKQMSQVPATKKTDLEIAQQFLLKRQEEQRADLTKKFNQKLSALFKSDVDTLVSDFIGDQDFPLMLEIKKVEQLEAIAVILGEAFPPKPIKREK